MKIATILDVLKLGVGAIKMNVIQTKTAMYALIQELV